MKIGVPSGIGDISWIVSKLINAPQWEEIEFVVADGWPFRAAPYLEEMLGRKATYGEFQYDTIVSFESMQRQNAKDRYNTWDYVVRSGFGIHYLQPNHHLEKGWPLKDWLPDLETNYHYPVSLPSITGREYHSPLSNSNDKWVGVSAASYRGHKAWKTWDMGMWKELLTPLVSEGFRICFMGGSWDDLTRGLASDMIGEHGSRVMDLVGQTTFPEACAIHKLLPYFIGYSSGIGIIRTVMSLPTMVLWPDHQIPLSDSWADPEDIASGRYIPSQYIEPDIIRNIFMGQVRNFGG